MPASVIKIENLSKRYILGARVDGIAQYDTLREAIVRNLKRAFSRRSDDAGTRFSPRPHGPLAEPPVISVVGSPLVSDLRSLYSEFWALKDVSITVDRGEVLGIIGRNGAGKSTLLKILSRITEPTSGRVSVRGRLASLLEVGTGFHPELTGRENIFLNGVILGMTRAEVRKRFDEIVAFAEVEQFLDTPVKHYSSGMYVRLAFAVAAHLEADILVVDEVLAVGDALFQKKCLGKMQEVSSREGRTVLFVSHNLVSMTQLCSRLVLLQKGAVTRVGAPMEIARDYLGIDRTADRIQSLSQARRDGNSLRGRAQLLTIERCGESSDLAWTIPFAASLQLLVTLVVHTPLEEIELGFGIFNAVGLEVISILSSWSGRLGPLSIGQHDIRVDFGTLSLAPGSYRFGVGLRSDRGLEDYVPDACHVDVVSSIDSSERNIDTVRGAIIRTANFSLD